MPKNEVMRQMRERNTTFCRLLWKESKNELLSELGWKAKDITAYVGTGGSAELYHQRTTVWHGHSIHNCWEARYEGLTELVRRKNEKVQANRNP